MPSGKVHNLINTLSLVACAGLYGVAVGQRWLPPMPEAAVVFAAAFAAGTFLLSPDLDLAEQNVGPKNAWGPLGVLWVPYGLVMSHRGTSHSWVVGPLTRLLYLLGIVAVLGLVLYAIAYGLARFANLPLDLAWLRINLNPQDWNLSGVRLDVFVAMLAGYYLSQWLHLVADGVWPDLIPHQLTKPKSRKR
jgi:uncharacterized metal-binding protein